MSLQEYEYDLYKMQLKIKVYQQKNIENLKMKNLQKIRNLKNIINTKDIWDFAKNTLADLSL